MVCSAYLLNLNYRESHTQQCMKWYMIYQIYHEEHEEKQLL